MRFGTLQNVTLTPELFELAEAAYNLVGLEMASRSPIDERDKSNIAIRILQLIAAGERDLKRLRQSALDGLYA